MVLDDFPPEAQALLDEITRSKKYRDLILCQDTLRDLILQELKKHRKKSDALHAVRKKLHNVAAPYLGDPDYPQAASWLEAAFASQEAETTRQAGICQACAQVMSAHTSTRERLPILEQVYPAIFAITGQPATLLDVACGLHPLSFPWMGLPLSTRFYAYDLHSTRVDFLNHYFGLQGLERLAKCQDVLSTPPEESGDVAFIFKEVHRFEQRRQGCTLPLLEALRVRYVVVSLPTHNMTGQRDFASSYRRMFEKMLIGKTWEVRDVEFETELFLCVDKGTV